jgi:hypothetical protein
MRFVWRSVSFLILSVKLEWNFQPILKWATFFRLLSIWLEPKTELLCLSNSFTNDRTQTSRRPTSTRFIALKVANTIKCVYFQMESWVYTSGFPMHLPHCVAVFYNLPWFCSIEVNYKKLQFNAENACGNRMCKKALSYRSRIASCNDLKAIFCGQESVNARNQSEQNFIPLFSLSSLALLEKKQLFSCVTNTQA